jgi:hypothetical protein
MPVAARSITLDQATVLDQAFKRALDDDLQQLALLAHGMGDRSLARQVPINKNRLATLLSEELQLDENGVKNRLYGNAIARRVTERKTFMNAVGNVLGTWFIKAGGKLLRDYGQFADPVLPGDEEGTTPVTGVLGAFPDWAHVRIGAWLADTDNPAHVDKTHHFELLARTDLLEYASGDFYSIRRLRGRNVSSGPSLCLTYRESSERPFTFASANIRAKDVASRKSLAVEPEASPDLASHTQAFSIYFAEPVPSGGEFDIVYALRAPGELEDLGRRIEVMSVSLSRIEKGVDRLEFNVALSFEPTTAAAYNLTSRRQFIPSNEPPPTIESYQPVEWYEKPAELGIEWQKGGPSIIRWATDKPTGRMYVIAFAGGPGSPLANR